MSKMLSGIFFLFAFPITLLAQSIQVTPGEITDNRSNESYFGKLELTLIVTGADIAKCRGIRFPVLTKAVDDSGKNLLVTKKTDESNPSVYDFRKLDGEKIETEIEMKSPVRKAKTIQEISGTIEVHYPERDSKSKLVVKGFMNQTGKPLNLPTLKKAKAQVSILTKPQFEAMQKAKEEEEQKGKKDGLEEMLIKGVSSLFSGFFSMDDNDLLLLIDDPMKQIVDVEFINGSGEVIELRGRSVQSGQLIYSFDTLPDTNSQLVIFSATATSIKKVPFTLKNVALP